MLLQTSRSFVFFVVAGIGLFGFTLMTASPAQAQSSISTTGEIESDTGFRFPDGNLQETAAEDLLYKLSCADGEVAVSNGTFDTGQWECGTAPEGPQGEKGDTGDDGAPGAPGTPGADGDDGADGANCYDGIGTTTADCIGATGDKGDDGLEGTSCTVAACPAEGVTTLSCGDGSQVQIACIPSYEIGDTGPGGGIVFHVTDGGLHGLEAALEDQGTSVQWGCYQTAIAGADGAAVDTGAQNTVDILAGCAARPIAASLASEYVWPEGQMDGFLPSKDALDLMYDNIGPGAIEPYTNVGGFASDYYWSSSENSADQAWIRFFVSYDYWAAFQKSSIVSVRAVRAF